jgi:hypothetical protein
MAQDIRQGIVATANALGISPIDLATAISYETAGTFDPAKSGPTTKWGQHRGLIQFGEPQAQKYGVDWQNPVGSQLGENGAVAKYLRDTGVKPGMGLMDVYSAINAGGVGRYDRSDAAAGGAPGTVADKVNNQMAGHREKAMALLGDMAPSQSYAGMADGPKGQEAYSAPVMGSMMASAPSPQPSSAIPAGVQASATPSSSSSLGDVFGMLAAQAAQPQQQAAPVQVMGPSPEQANALSNFLQSLRGRPV